MLLSCPLTVRCKGSAHMLTCSQGIMHAALVKSRRVSAVMLHGRYNYKHYAIVGAVGESAEGGMSFSFWEDKVRCRPCPSSPAAPLGTGAVGCVSDPSCQGPLLRRLACLNARSALPL